MKKGNVFLLIIILTLLFSSCEQEQEYEHEQFITSEYKIISDTFFDVLNIENPQYIKSENITVAIVEFDNKDIIITSIGQGKTDILIGDKIGLSNQARISIFIDTTGQIIIENVDKFDGRAVTPNIKNAVKISGITESEITQTRIDLQMNGTHFIVDYDMDVTSWFTNIPSGLSAHVFDMFASNPERGPNEVYIIISGTPKTKSTEVINITVPSVNTGRGWDVHFNTRENAVFNIN